MRGIIKASLIAAAATVAVGCSTTEDVVVDTVSGADASLQKELDMLKQKNAALNAKLMSGTSNELLPPNAQPGHCYARVLTPAQYRTEYVKVETKGKSEAIKIVPATYKHDNKKILVQEASEKIVVVAPAKYETRSEKVLVRDGYKTWKKGRGPIERIDSSTGEIMCLVEVPAQYKTVTRKVMVAPPQTKKIVIPAKYKEVHRHVVDRPAQVLKQEIPAQYGKVAKRIKVSEATLEWREILCETNTSPDIVRRLQLALRNKGFNPGPIDGVIGIRTMAAVRAFQASQNLPKGQLTISTMKALGVL